MFETGLGLIVVCLPSLYVLTRAMWSTHFKDDTSRFNQGQIIIATEKSPVRTVIPFGQDIESFQS